MNSDDIKFGLGDVSQHDLNNNDNKEEDGFKSEAGFGEDIYNDNSVSEARESQYTSSRYDVMMKRIRRNTSRMGGDNSFKSKNAPSMSYDTREKPLDDILETDRMYEE